MANPTVRDSERVKRIGRYLAGKKCWFRLQRSGALSEGVDEEAASGVSVQRRERAARGGQNYVRRAGDTECGEGPGNRVQANPAPPSATMGLVNRRGLVKAKHVDMQYLWIQEAFMSRRFVTKKVGTNVNPADLMTKPLSKS